MKVYLVVQKITSNVLCMLINVDDTLLTVVLRGKREKSLLKRIREFANSKKLEYVERKELNCLILFQDEF